MDKDYFQRCEEIQESVFSIQNEFYQTLLQPEKDIITGEDKKSGFKHLVDEGIIDIKQNGSNVQVSSKIRVRIEPLFSDAPIHPQTSHLSEVRMHRPEAMSYIDSPPTNPEGCSFCMPKLENQTPNPKIYHDDLRTHSGQRVVSFPNLFSFGENHFITVFGDHYQDIRDLNECDLESFFFSACDLGKIMMDKGNRGMWSFINFGKEAGASQTHPHSHSINKPIMDTWGLDDIEMIATEYTFQKTNKDPFVEYIDNMRDSPYFIFENDVVFICAPFAPHFPDQVDIIPKRKIRNVVDLTGKNSPISKDEERIMVGSVLGAFHALREKRGVTDFNFVIHQQDFHGDGIPYRLHFHITPRNKNKFGGLEAYFGSRVIPVDPVLTARELREHYSK